MSALNPNAMVFIPGQGLVPAAAAAAAPEPVAEPEPTPAPVVAEVEEEPVAQDNWEQEAEEEAQEAAPVANGDAAAAADVAEEAEEDEEDDISQYTAEEIAEAKEIEAMEAAIAARRAAAGPKSAAQLDTREHLNLVCIGHVDAGKSTISGQILLSTGQIDERTIAKYEKDAKDQNRESWWIAFIMDTGEEERAKGKTVEVGRAQFQTPNKRYTLLDAPGHASYVPNMIGGASQADVGILVISARRGEFETGFDRGGQTREHAMLAKTLGISKVIVAVNKMDDKTVDWSKERFDQIQEKLGPFLKKWGYKPKDIFWIPVSGFTGLNINRPVGKELCPWYEGKGLLDTLDAMEPLERQSKGPVRLPLLGAYKDMGAVCVIGKLECGTLRRGDEVRLEPSGLAGSVLGLEVDEVEVEESGPGENLVVKLKGFEEEDVRTGFVLTTPQYPLVPVAEFEAQIVVQQLLAHKPLLTAGYKAVLHVHSLAVECTIDSMVSEFNTKVGKFTKRAPTFLKSGGIGMVRIHCDETIAVECFSAVQQMGRFTLRDEGKTIALGKVLNVFPKQ